MRIVEAANRYIPLGVDAVNRGFPVVLPTDTLYGICADATNPEAVERVYTLKWRNPQKPLIVLIESLHWLEKFFGVKPSEGAERLLLYGKPISVVLPVNGFEYLTRGREGIAFRLVKGGFIKDFLKSLGKPIVAPSANWEGHPPAENPFHAYLYFGDAVPVYYNAGNIRGEPSALCAPHRGGYTLLRKGLLDENDLKFLENFLKI